MFTSLPVFKRQLPNGQDRANYDIIELPWKDAYTVSPDMHSSKQLKKYYNTKAQWL